MKRFLLPVVFVILFISESLFLQLLPVKWFNHEQIFVPHFLLIGLLFLTIYSVKNQALIYAFVFGLLFDIVYTEIIGVYLFLFPLLTYLTSYIMRVIYLSMVIATFVSVIGVALLELGVYELNLIINLIDMDFQTFAQSRLVPTLLLNLAFAGLMSYPFKRIFEKLTTSVIGE